MSEPVETSFREWYIAHTSQENTRTLTYWFDNISNDVLREFRQYICWGLVWNQLTKEQQKEFEEDWEKDC